MQISRVFADEVRQEAALVHRSEGAQLEYWARLGQALENAPGFGVNHMHAALDGRNRLEDLSVEQRDVIFDQLGSLFDRSSMALNATYAELGRREGVVGSDGSGQLVQREPHGRLRRIA